MPDLKPEDVDEVLFYYSPVTSVNLNKIPNLAGLLLINNT